MQEAWYQVHQDLIKRSWKPLLFTQEIALDEEDEDENIHLATLAAELNEVKPLGEQIFGHRYFN